MKKRIVMSIGCLACVMATVFFSGCMTTSLGSWRDCSRDLLSRECEEIVRNIPEKGVGLKIKTSELNKLLRGRAAKVLIVIKDETVLSNTNDRISVGLKGITNGLELVCVLTNAWSMAFKKCYDNNSEESKRKYMDGVRPYHGYQTLELEDSDSDNPVLKKTIGYRAPIGYKEAGGYDEEGCFVICKLDQDEGKIKIDVPSDLDYSSALVGARCMLDALKTDDDGYKTAVRMFCSVSNLWGKCSRPSSGVSNHSGLSYSAALMGVDSMLDALKTDDDGCKAAERMSCSVSNLREKCSRPSPGVSNHSGLSCSSAVMEVDSMLDALKTDDDEYKAVDRIFFKVAKLHEWLTSRPNHIYVVIYGDDDEAVRVVCKDIMYDGKRMEDWERLVQKGDRFAIEILNKSGAGVHFYRKRRWWLLWLF